MSRAPHTTAAGDSLRGGRAISWWHATPSDAGAVHVGSVSAIHWREAPSTFPLHPHDVHVYAGTLDHAADHAADHADQALLSLEERARAARFRFERDRRRYVAGRSMLRRILSRYTGVSPDQLLLRTGARGKPSLVQKPVVHFNVAHSGSLALYAITLLSEVGIDVEALEPVPECEVIAERFFSASERRELHEVPEADRAAAFLTCWTRKEAYVKAIGEGLACPLDCFDVTFTPGHAPRFLRIEGDDETAWTLLDLQPAVGYVGALAIRAAAPQLQCWRWDTSTGEVNDARP
jgi:4'-phosphopantetheinyl transferase